MTETEKFIRALADKAGRPIEQWQFDQFVRLYVQRLIAPSGYLPGAPVGPMEFPRDPVPFRHPVQQHRYNVWCKAAYPAAEFDEAKSLNALEVDGATRTRIADECEFIRDHTPSAPVWKIPDDPFPGRGWLSDEAERPAASPVPQPATTPPMWANDPTRSRRPKRRRGQPNRQGIA